MRLKHTKKYYFSVEGETEQWYLKWLQNLINQTPESKIKVSFDCPVQKNPLRRAKSIVLTGKTEIYHISDYESNDETHVREFKETIDRMSEAKKIGKQIKRLLEMVISSNFLQLAHERPSLIQMR